MSDGETVLISDEMTESIIQTARRMAISSGAENVSVRRILNELEITNRVFYNRFHNIDEVLNTVYEEMALEIRKSITVDFKPESDFFAQVTDIVAGTLRMSYDIKKNFSRYVFESDSVSQKNYEWWRTQIARLIELGKARGCIRDVDTDAMSYAIWCFIRGYNADAIGRGLPKESAITDFKYCFGVLLDGMRK